MDMVHRRDGRVRGCLLRTANFFFFFSFFLFVMVFCICLFLSSKHSNQRHSRSKQLSRQLVVDQLVRAATTATATFRPMATIAWRVVLFCNLNRTRRRWRRLLFHTLIIGKVAAQANSSTHWQESDTLHARNRTSVLEANEDEEEKRWRI